MFGFNFSKVRSLCRCSWAGVLSAVFGVFIFMFIAFDTPAYALGLDLGVAKIGLDKSGLKVSAGEGTVSAMIGSDSLVDGEGEEVTAAGVDLDKAAVVTDSPKASDGESSPVAEHLVKDLTAPLAESDSGRDAKVAKVSSPLVELGGILADAGDSTIGLVGIVTNDTAVIGSAVPAILPVTDVTSGVLEPASKLINGAVATVAEVTVADQILETPSPLLTPVLETVDGLLKTDFTQTVQSLLPLVSDKSKGIIGTACGLLPVVNEVLELGLLPGEEIGSSCTFSPGVNTAPEEGFTRQQIFNKGQTIRLNKRFFPNRNQIGVESKTSSGSGMNVNAGSGTGAGGSQAAVNNDILRLDRLPLNGVITDFLDPDRSPPFISLFSPPG